MKLWAKISLLTILLLSILGIVIGIIIKQHTEEILLDEYNHWGAGLTQAISSSILRDTIQKKQRSVKDILQRVKKNNEDIAYLLVIDFEGNIFASTTDEIPNSEIAASHSEHTIGGINNKTYDDHLITDISHPLVENLDAHLHIGISQHALETAIQKTKDKLLIGIMSVSLLAMIITIIFSRQISKPIEKLSLSMRAFGTGKPYEKVDCYNASVEVKNLCDSFQHMVNERGQHEAELKSYRDRLEELVKQRTKELENEIQLHKETEQQLILSKEEAERANSAKSGFLSQMSHELRTPLNAILGFSQLLEMEQSLSNDVKNNLKIIMNSGEHLLQLINEILDLAKVESGNLEVSIEAVSWDNIIQNCIDLTQSAALEKNIKVTLHNDANIPFFVSADQMRLKQISLNLISNAIKYNKEHGLVNIYLEAVDNNFIKLSVEDTGLGISDKHQTHIFEPFNRLAAEHTNIEGTGIGLLITKRLTEVMQGEIGFDSKENIGSTFWIKLPIAEMHQTITHTKEQHNIDSNLQLNKKYVVLQIEDNPINLKLVEKALQSIDNLEVVSANHPQKGLELARQSPPDLILLDIHMPDMNGYEVKKQLETYSSLKDIPVIAISANAMKGDIEKALSLGFTDYITKPLKIKDLIAVIQKYVDKTDLN